MLCFPFSTTGRTVDFSVGDQPSRLNLIGVPLVSDQWRWSAVGFVQQCGGGARDVHDTTTLAQSRDLLGVLPTIN